MRHNLTCANLCIRLVKVNYKSQMVTNNLREVIKSDIESGLKPFLVIANAGTTHCGAVDPLSDIGAIAKEHDIWYHIDGAYGGFFILVDSLRDKFEGIQSSDSLVIDPHKSLFVPFGLGAVLIKDKSMMKESVKYQSGSYFQDFESVASKDIFLESTRHFRGPRLWIPLKYHGLEPFKDGQNGHVDEFCFSKTIPFTGCFYMCAIYSLAVTIPDKKYSKFLMGSAQIFWAYFLLH